jgi:glycosyltransferase involved in cell wall biosynthesis
MNWRTDYRLLHSLATTHPEWSLVFVSSLSDKSLIKDLKKLPNVYFLGIRSYFSIPQLIRAFDVCIIPYKNTGVENSPIKLFDYLASGKPIVTTRIPGVMDFADVVYIANSEEDFSKKVEQALNEPPTLAEHRLARAKENSWDIRVKEVWEMIVNKLDSRI